MLAGLDGMPIDARIERCRLFGPGLLDKDVRLRVLENVKPVNVHCVFVTFVKMILIKRLGLGAAIGLLVAAYKWFISGGTDSGSIFPDMFSVLILYFLLYLAMKYVSRDGHELSRREKFLYVVSIAGTAGVVVALYDLLMRITWLEQPDSIVTIVGVISTIVLVLIMGVIAGAHVFGGLWSRTSE